MSHVIIVLPEQPKGPGYLGQDETLILGDTFNGYAVRRCADYFDLTGVMTTDGYVPDGNAIAAIIVNKDRHEFWGDLKNVVAMQCAVGFDFSLSFPVLVTVRANEISSKDEAKFFAAGACACVPIGKKSKNEAKDGLLSKPLMEALMKHLSVRHHSMPKPSGSASRFG